MKNRAVFLCITNKIESIEEYARRIGVSTSRAELILKEKVILTQEEINSNCQLFNVTPEYFLGLTEA